MRQLTIVQVYEPGRLNIRGDTTGCNFSRGQEHGCYILTSRFKRTELWFFLKTKSILRWDICKLMFCGNRKKKISGGKPWGNRIDVSPKYVQGRSEPCKVMLPQAHGTEWPNIKDPWANNGVRRGQKFKVAQDQIRQASGNSFIIRKERNDQVK